MGENKRLVYQYNVPFAYVTDQESMLHVGALLCARAHVQATGYGPGCLFSDLKPVSHSPYWAQACRGMAIWLFSSNPDSEGCVRNEVATDKLRNGNPTCEPSY